MRKKVIYIAAALAAYKVAVAYAYNPELRGLISDLKEQYGEVRDVPSRLVLAIARVESSLNPKARGQAGEYGLMQIHPVTWHWIWKHWGYPEPADPYDPAANLLAGMLILKTYHDNLGSWWAAIQAYNVGVGAYHAGIRAPIYLSKVLSYWAII